MRMETMSRFMVEFGKDGLLPADEGRLDAPAFHRNCEPIWQAISPLLTSEGAVLEIGSGTGQHVTTYAARTPRLTWYPTDILDSHLTSIEAWRRHAGAANVQPPQRLDLCDRDWTWMPGGPLAAMLCVNVLHIAPWPVSQNLIGGAARFLEPTGRLFVYGPFMRHGAHTAPSNASFDASLRAQNPAWGVRDTRDLAALASAHKLVLADIISMPANNFVLAFARADRT
jgi:SAM-dependent methyltransferase